MSKTPAELAAIKAAGGPFKKNPSKVIMTEVVAPAPIATAAVPVEAKTQAEIHYGRQKVEEHANRERMLDAKRTRGDEEAHVADAKSQNSEL